MGPWTTTLQVSQSTARILVTTGDGNELLRCRLPARPSHPRAPLTLFEGLALWNGSPLCVATFVSGSCPPIWFGPDSFGDAAVGGDSALVRYDLMGQTGARRRLRGVGDFRDMLRVHGRGW